MLKLHQVHVNLLVKAYTDSCEPYEQTYDNRTKSAKRKAACGLAVTVHDGLIREIQDGRGDEDIWLSPGFVDLQVNGYGGDDVNHEEPHPEAIISLTRKMICSVS
jgi:N-acetylglucosamine-6-phosphate deacetylase